MILHLSALCYVPHLYVTALLFCLPFSVIDKDVTDEDSSQEKNTAQVSLVSI